MSFHYPYHSDLKALIKSWEIGQDYVIWHTPNSIDEQIHSVNGPIIEIGGPTDLGFYFLEGVALPTKPIITNISSNPSPFAENATELAQQVVEIIDARQMPYKDDSVGIFLMSGMSVSSDWWVELNDRDKDKESAKIDEEFDKAKMEMGLVATGTVAAEKATYAQRVQIFREVARCLKEGGLFFSDGSLEDIIILKQLGFNLIAFLQYQDHGIEGWQNLSYEFVVTK